ncbi:MAG: hypothetical protein K0R29_1347 [Pseudobdellovibrio sp.]|jgi:hypothetical protein|nr:hypothetical protein [Pseudobdellovibrio sp.]
MSSNNSFYQQDRRKNLREESTDRRNELRPSNKLKGLKIVVAVVLILIAGTVIYLLNQHKF